MGLRDRFHGGMATLTTRHPRWVIAVALLVTVLSGRLALVPLENIDTDILRQLPSDLPEVAAYRRAVHEFGALDHLYGVIEATQAEPDVPLLIAAAEGLARALENPEFVFEVQWSLDPDTQDHYGDAAGVTYGSLLPAEDWDAIRAELFSPEALRRQAIRQRHLLTSPLSGRFLRAQLAEPFGLSGQIQRRLLMTRSPIPFDPRSGHFLSPDQRMLLLVIRPFKPPTDLLFSQALMHHVREAAGQVERQFSGEIEIGFLGPHSETLYDTGLLRRDVMATGIASGLCVISLFIIAFRRWSAVLFVGLPLLFGNIWTLGLVGLFLSHLTIVTCAFAAIVLGIGIDFGIHLYNRFLEDRLQGHPTAESVRRALVEVGPGILTGALTTALAFFALLLTDFPGFRELGLIGGMGVICCLIAMYTVMPALLMILHHRRPRSRYQRLTSFGLEALADAIARRPRTTLLAALILTAWLGFLSLSLVFDDNLFHLRDPPPSQVALRTRVTNQFRLPGQPLMLTLTAGPDLQTALQANDALSRRLSEIGGLFDFASIDSLRTLLPSESEQGRSLAAIGSLDVGAVTTQFASAAAEMGLSPEVTSPSETHLRAWIAATMASDPLRLSLASRRSLRRLVTNYVAHAGDQFRVLTTIYPQRMRLPAPDQETLLREASGAVRRVLDLPPGTEAPLEVTGLPALVDELRSLIKRDLALMVFVVTVSVVCVLWLHFGSIRTALLVTVPVLAALLWMLGLLAAAGKSLNFINVLAIPITIGLGMDNGLHILERMRSSANGRIDEALIHSGRAVVISSLSNMLGFGALSLASFRGIQEMGVLAIIGVALSLITSITLIPALIQTVGGRAGWRGLLKPDEG